jgi:hypothetical protein
LEAGAIDLVEEVSERLSSSQLNQINATLRARPSEGGDRLEGLRLKEAYALLREGEVDEAICLVNTLRISPHLEKEVLRFYDEAGLNSGKVPILEQRLSAKLQEISRDSPKLAEALSIIHQLHKAELHTLSSLTEEVVALSKGLVQVTSQCKNTQSASEALLRSIEGRSQKAEADTQEALNSLKTSVGALTGDYLMAGEEEIKQVKRAKDAQIQSLDEKLNTADTATQLALNILREDLWALRENLDVALSQCKSKGSKNNL